MPAERIMLVDEDDNPRGYGDKLEAHENGGTWHRAFSIFILNPERTEMLLQLRSEKKYHFGGLWTNACCSHHKEGKTLEENARSELLDEMGMRVPLEELFTFSYEAHDEDSGFTEKEIDHVFIGEFDGEPEVNPDEADDWKWVSLDELERDVEENPDGYSPWFRIALPSVLEHVRS